MDIDAQQMRRAIRLGRRALGTTAENPPVGCVIAQGADVVGVGWTQPGGRPHAEPQALAMAGGAARGATAYVTLEPCAHQGRTGPCATALAEAGVTRVVMACGDPDPRVNGKGAAMLSAAGIAVETRQETVEELQGFFTRITKGRPQVLLKMAISADGMIAEGPRRRTAISHGAALAHVHLMRARADAILVGRETAEADDPSLRCRLPGLDGRSPLRLIASNRYALPAHAKCQPAEVLRTADGLAVALNRLAQRGINRLMLEGGAVLARSFLVEDLVDEVTLLRSPEEIGPQGVHAPLDEIHARFILRELAWLGPDRLTRYEPRG